MTAQERIHHRTVLGRLSKLEHKARVHSAITTALVLLAIFASYDNWLSLPCLLTCGANLWWIWTS